MSKHDQLLELAAIHPLMECSLKFLPLSGLAGIIAGLYALASACIAYAVFNFSPDALIPGVMRSETPSAALAKVILPAVSTAFLLSARNTNHRSERTWNAASRRLLVHMAVPLIAGGNAHAYFSIEKADRAAGSFYALSAVKHTYEEVSSLGIIQVVPG